jgi:hypothetical protein
VRLMTKEEFIEAYCARSKVTWQWLSQYMVALPCACDDAACQGWAMVSPEGADSQIALYGPEGPEREAAIKRVFG